ncbi:DUF2628 domain-containing protein [Marinobacter sp. CHS3-4]|uniref:DUF2628 domain-containing protein n=1 Tax=Marinobacter sp. CHS3-4 TaxID=3045174 RepID=UPI0024B519DB|nr:DUF2628 domain-containing protein [Marinobacter sp. CHS3-4]MDI9243843.1 DUF2628 domain-containing protein [Marinobacter sp. CHS3-4]
MNTYYIYSHPEGKLDAVKRGWSWPAAFLGGFWALSKKLWWPAVAVFLVAIFGWFMAPVLSRQGIAPDTTQLAYIVIAAVIFRVFGTHGNRWHETRLCRAGYRLVAELSEIDAERAIFEYKKSLSDSDAVKA